jgi:hypothetical protein
MGCGEHGGRWTLRSEEAARGYEGCERKMEGGGMEKTSARRREDLRMRVKEH